jgi:hypothetical protein
MLTETHIFACSGGGVESLAQELLGTKVTSEQAVKHQLATINKEINSLRRRLTPLEKQKNSVTGGLQIPVPEVDTAGDVSSGFRKAIRSVSVPSTGESFAVRSTRVRTVSFWCIDSRLGCCGTAK